MTLSPRHLTWTGARDVSGWWVPRRLGQARVLALWRAGTVVYETEHGWWLRLPESELQRAPWPATPLVLLDGLLCGCPLTASEREEAHGVFARPASGVLVCETPTVDQRVDPAEWIDLDGLEWPEAVGLGPLAARVVNPEPVVVEREDFGVPPADPELASLLAELRGAGREGDAEDDGADDISARPEPTDTLWQSLLRRALALGQWLSVPSAQPAQAPGSSVEVGKGGRSLEMGEPTGALAPPAPTLLQRLGGRLDAWARSLLMASGLGSVARRRQAAFLQDLLEQLDGGNTLEALKRAIPLGGEGGDDVREWLGLPNTRQQLSPSLQRSGGGAGKSLGLGDNLYALLTRKYKAAAVALERDGQIEEAAFVLSDLLNQPAEAIALLERHGRWALAAQLASARDLAPDLQVRLWWLAGDKTRALSLARRFGAWHQVLGRLDPDSSEHQLFRRAFAVELARSGRFFEAIDVGLPLGKGFVRGWVELVVKAGGPAAVTMQVRALQLGLTEWSEHGPALAALLRDPTPESAERMAAVEALARDPAVPSMEGLRRQALRVVLGDAHEPRSARLVQTLRRSVRHSALASDLPPLPDAMEDLAARYTLPAEPRGVSAVLDAAWVDQGGVLLALGEAGVWLVDPDGRPRHHFDVPASQLVVSHDGHRVIAVAHRGEVQALSRIEVVERRCERWCDAELTSWAPAYDGARWFVVEGTDVVALDALDPKLRALWRVNTDGEHVLHLRVTPHHVTALVAERSFTSLEGWRWELPSITLRDRWPVESAHEDVWLAGPIGARGSHVGLIASTVREDGVRVRVAGGNTSEEHAVVSAGELLSSEPEVGTGGTGLPELVMGTGPWSMVRTDERGVRLEHYRLPYRLRLTLVVHGGTEPRVRIDGNGVLTYADHEGRVWVWDDAAGRVRADFRTRL